MSSPPPESILHLAVYGTLRDDDDSGASWTLPFLAGLHKARSGKVPGIDLYWDQTLNYPFAVPNSESSSFLKVRLLSWASAEKFAEKLQAADEIEGFKEKDEENSEYVRRAVKVIVEREEGEGCDISDSDSSCWAWIYFPARATVDPAWVALKGGDWMKRKQEQ